MSRVEVIGRATLILGDCRDVLPTLADDCVDITVTSPPYNMGLSPGGNGRGLYRVGEGSKGARFREGYGDFDDAMVPAEYDAWQRDMLAQMFRCSRMAVFYNHRPRVIHGVLQFPLGLSFGIPLRQIIIWDRGTGIDVNLRSYCTRQEWICLFTKPDFKLRDHAASGAGDVWRLGIETDRTGHPAPFPLSLPTKAIETTAANTTLDPFMGSGTTGVAAVQMGKDFIGIEREERYFDIACRRIDQAQRQGDFFIEGAAA